MRGRPMSGDISYERRTKVSRLRPREVTLHHRKIALAGEVDRGGRHFQRQFVEVAKTTNLKQQVARLTTAERPVDGTIVLFNQMVHGVFAKLKTHLRRHKFEQIAELLFR